jgi:hypothetical protein
MFELRQMEAAGLNSKGTREHLSFVLFFQNTEFTLSTVGQTMETEDEELVFDKRALRMPNSVSSYQIFIPGVRFTGQWLLTYMKKVTRIEHVFSSLIAFLTRFKVGSNTPSTPMICCCTPLGLCMMLPVQKLLVPLFWSEIGTTKVKKDLLSFVHTVTAAVGGEEQSQNWSVRVADASAMNAAMQKALHDRLLATSRPYPSIYPPPKPEGMKQNALSLPQAPSNETEAKARDETVSKIQRERAEKLRKVSSCYSVLILLFYI